MKKRVKDTEEWQKNEQLYFDMPEYNNIDMPKPVIEAVFRFRSQEDFDRFHALIKEHLFDGQRVFDGMQKKDKKSAWYPLLEKPSKYEYK